MAKPASNILVVGPSWVGDMVMAQALFMVLLQRHSSLAGQPPVTIDVLAPQWSLALLERMPQVRQGLMMPLGHGQLALRERLRLGRQMQRAHYEQAIVLPNSLKSAFIPLFANIPQRTGWRGEMRYGLLNDLRPLDKVRYPLMVERFVALAYPKGQALPKPLPRPSLQSDQQNCRAAVEKLQLKLDRPRLALCPGAEFGDAKQWPVEHYGALAATYIDRGWDVWLFGSANDCHTTERIVAHLKTSQTGRCLNLAGQTSLGEVVDLLALADAVASNDSGLMHIAAALDKPLLVFYGSTSADFTPPLSSRAATLSVPVDCGPCFQRQCPLGHRKCLYGITPQMAVEALDRLLASKDQQGQPT